MPGTKIKAAVAAVLIAVVSIAGYGTHAQTKPETPAAEGGETETPVFKPGQVFRDCPECPELAVVPAGIYIMGLNGKSKKSKPPHRVNIAKPFALGRFEVTFD